MVAKYCRDKEEICLFNKEKKNYQNDTEDYMDSD